MYDTYGPIIFFKFFYHFLKAGTILVNLRAVRKNEMSAKQLNLSKTKDEQMSKLSLIILVGISLS